MTVAGLILTTVLAVPPDQLAENHAHPGHSGQPVVRRFERRDDDEARRVAWDSYVRELEVLWADYRQKGSTGRAWRDYIRAVGQAKRRYIFADPDYVPVIR